MGIVHEAVEDGVGECRGADDLVALLDGKLAGDGRRADAVSPQLDLFSVHAHRHYAKCCANFAGRALV